MIARVLLLIAALALSGAVMGCSTMRDAAVCLAQPQGCN